MNGQDTSIDTGARQCATFYVAEQLIGIDIRLVQEINRHVRTTSVPHTNTSVRGVLNLRGDVVTVLDLRTILGLPPIAVTGQTRNLVVALGGEKTGLLVDRIAEVVTLEAGAVEPPPANVSKIDHRFMLGVAKLESELLVVLDAEAVLAERTIEERGEAVGAGRGRDGRNSDER